MTRLIKALPIFLLLLVLGSCGKETQTFEPTESSTQMIANVSGIVLDEEGNPIPDVQISYRSNVTMTNKSGLYQYEGVSEIFLHCWWMIYWVRLLPSAWLMWNYSHHQE